MPTFACPPCCSVLDVPLFPIRRAMCQGECLLLIKGTISWCAAGPNDKPGKAATDDKDLELQDSRVRSFAIAQVRYLTDAGVAGLPVCACCIPQAWSSAVAARLACLCGTC